MREILKAHSSVKQFTLILVDGRKERRKHQRKKERKRQWKEHVYGRVVVVEFSVEEKAEF